MTAPTFRDVAAKMLDLAADHPAVMLKCVLDRLEAFPSAWRVVGMAADDFAAFLRDATEREILATETAAAEAAARLDAILSRKPATDTNQ